MAKSQDKACLAFVTPPWRRTSLRGGRGLKKAGKFDGLGQGQPQMLHENRGGYGLPGHVFGRAFAG